MSKAKVILGIGYGSHDSSAAVMVEGKLKAAIEQERINLVKHTEAFPLEAAKACLASLGLSMADVDLVFFYFLYDFVFFIFSLFLNFYFPIFYLSYLYF